MYQVGKILGEGAFGIVASMRTPDGKKAVMKSPLAASHIHEMTHEGAVLAVLERCRQEWPDALGRDNVPSLVATPGTLSPKCLTYDEGAMSESQAPKYYGSTAELLPTPHRPRSCAAAPRSATFSP